MYMNQFRQHSQISARLHTQTMDKLYLDKIMLSVNRSKIYTNATEFDEAKQKTKTEPIEQIVERTDSVSAVKKYYKQGKIAVLNFASFKHPGGGFITGSMAQEESLCHESILYNVIADEYFSHFYSYNNQHLNRGMYHNRAIYSPDVLFTNSDNSIGAFADVITCACPNYSRYIRMNVKPRENYEALKSRIEFIKKILVDNDVEIAILGAYGCGVFCQKPEHVALLFKDTFNSGYTNNIKKVVYAIPGGANFKIFYNMFSRIDN